MERALAHHVNECKRDLLGIVFILDGKLVHEFNPTTEVSPSPIIAKKSKQTQMYVDSDRIRHLSSGATTAASQLI